MPPLKLIQKLIYDILSRKYFIVTFALISVTILAVLHLVEVYVFWYNQIPYVQNAYKYDEIDVVYTWVNGSDASFIRSLKKYSNIKSNLHISRFDDKSELKFSLRSLEKYAPWVRHVYIITNGQVPAWLDLQYDKVTLITHEDLTFLHVLPTFSSPAIETFIHKIPNLSRYFLYLNDDVLFGEHVWPDDFLTHSRGIRLFMAWNTPPCSTECPWSYIGDGSCDNQCNTIECQYDGGDCTGLDSLQMEVIKQPNDITKSSNSKSKKSIEVQREHPPISIHKRPSRNVNTNAMNNLKNDQINSNITDIIKTHNKAYLMRNKKYRRQTNTDEIKNYFSLEDNHNNNIHQDAYGDSLIYTNKVFNMRYGFKNRKVPAHVPILVDKAIIERLQNDFVKEIIATRQRKFRTGNDFQYSFGYYHYIMSEMKNLSASEIFDKFDTDQSGTWSDRELRTFLTRTNELPLEWSAIDSFTLAINSCSNKKLDNLATPANERYLDSAIPMIVKEVVINCGPLAEVLLENFAQVNRYKFEVIKQSSQYSTFQMLTSNVSEVVSALDDIRKFPRKFICINDNLDPNRPEDNELARALLEDFYRSLFPKRSRFELPNDYRNKFAYINDYRDFTYKMKCVQILMYAFVSTVIPIICCKFCMKNRNRRKYMTV